MAGWQIALLLIAVVLVIAWTIYDFFGDAQKFIAPDNFDENEIEQRLGKDTPEARTALKRRFGPDRHWLDARTGLAGLLGMAFIIWIWFG